MISGETVRNDPKRTTAFFDNRLSTSSMTSLLNRNTSSWSRGGVFRRLLDPELGQPIPVTEDELFDLLADSRRRAVIGQIADLESTESTTKHHLAREIAADETHMPADRLPEERIQVVAAELSRTHLPILDEADIVSWNDRTEAVSPGRSIEPIAEWLRSMYSHVEPDDADRRHHRAHVSYASWGSLDEG